MLVVRFIFYSLRSPLSYKLLIHCWISIVKRFVRKSKSIERAINASIELKRTIKIHIAVFTKYELHFLANFALYCSRDLIRFDAIFHSFYLTNSFPFRFFEIFVFLCWTIFWFVKCVLEFFVPSIVVPLLQLVQKNF